MYIINDITVLRIFQSACDHPEYDDAQKRQHGELHTKKTAAFATVSLSLGGIKGISLRS